MSLKESKRFISTQAVRLWKIFDDRLTEIEKPKLDLEERLEGWIASDISIISPNLLVIGRQVDTDFGGIIDLLCIDENGDIVVIELKRDKTPRDITAQVLDYASWVKLLTPERIQSIASEHPPKINLEEAYQMKFNQELPESINEEHRMLVVGSEIDSSSRRIINYLAETYGVPVNAVTFNYFKDGESELLARTFLIEQSKPQISGGRSKRRPRLTAEQLQEIADENGVGEIYAYLATELPAYFDGIRRTRSSLTLVGRFRERKRASIMNLYPIKSDVERGLNWEIYNLRFREYFELTEEEAASIIPANRQPWKYGTPGDQAAYRQSDIEEEWAGYTGYVKMDDALAFVNSLKGLNRDR